MVYNSTSTAMMYGITAAVIMYKITAAVMMYDITDEGLYMMIQLQPQCIMFMAVQDQKYCLYQYLD